MRTEKRLSARDGGKAVQVLDHHTLVTAHVEIHTAVGDGLHVAHAQHLVRICVLSQLLRLSLLALACLDGFLQRRCCHGRHVGKKVGDEVAPHHRAVLEDDALSSYHHRRGSFADVVEDCHAVCEEEEGDVLLHVEAHDLRRQGEWRVVDDDSVFGVRLVDVVTARVEGTHDVPPLQADLAPHILHHGLVHVLGRVCVVRGLRLLGVPFGHVRLVVVQLLVPPHRLWPLDSVEVVSEQILHAH